MLHNTDSHTAAHTHLYITGATADNYGVHSCADSTDRGPIAERAQTCIKGDKFNCM